MKKIRSSLNLSLDLSLHQNCGLAWDKTNSPFPPPSPVADLRPIISMPRDVLLMLNEFLAESLLGISARAPNSC